MYASDTFVEHKIIKLRDPALSNMQKLFLDVVRGFDELLEN